MLNQDESNFLEKKGEISASIGECCCIIHSRLGQRKQQAHGWRSKYKSMSWNEKFTKCCLLNSWNGKVEGVTCEASLGAFHFEFQDGNLFPKSVHLYLLSMKIWLNLNSLLILYRILISLPLLCLNFPVVNSYKIHNLWT